MFEVCEHYKDGGVTTSQFSFTTTDLIARLWELTHGTVVCFQLAEWIKLSCGVLRTRSQSGTQ